MIYIVRTRLLGKLFGWWVVRLVICYVDILHVSVVYDRHVFIELFRAYRQKVLVGSGLKKDRDIRRHTDLDSTHGRSILTP